MNLINHNKNLSYFYKDCGMTLFVGRNMLKTNYNYGDGSGDGFTNDDNRETKIIMLVLYHSLIVCGTR